MALKPPPLGDVIQQVNEMVGQSGLRGEVDRNARLLVQSALQRLDVVARDEFDAQSELLDATRARVGELERQVAELSATLEALEAADRGA
jgi:hypothetical protein